MKFGREGVSCVMRRRVDIALMLITKFNSMYFLFGLENTDSVVSRTM